MEQYHHLLKSILTDDASVYKPNRTGVDTISLFGAQEKFDLSKGFPLVTTKKIHLRSVVHELLWFLKGDTNINYLRDNKVTIWDEWADENGNLGPVYGKQWRSWPDYNGDEIDQLQIAVNTIKKSPDSRRMIVSAWNVGQLDEMALPPCHLLFQFYVGNRKGNPSLDLQLYQRSCDTFLGVPFNIASYALLLEIVANETNLKPGIFTHTYGDAHIYCGEGERGKFYEEHLDEVKKMILGVNKREDYRAVVLEIENMMSKNPKIVPKDASDHIPFCLEQLAREPMQSPVIKINPAKGINDITYEDIQIIGYESHPFIKGKVAV